MIKSVTLGAVETLIDCGVEYTFGIPGGGALLLYDALFQNRDRITSILARHEGAAACMADMYGRLTGKPAAVIGQGAWIGSNAAFGILEAYMSGSPMVIITDTSDYGRLAQYGPWQNGTGEYGAFDLPSMMRSITKYTTVATSPDEVLHGIQLAVRHAVTGRPGPACVIARMNLFSASYETDTLNPVMHPAAMRLETARPCIGENEAVKAAGLLASARNPVMITGIGVHTSKAYEEVKELSDFLGMPVATSYMGKSGIAETHDLALGTMGAIGQKVANETIMSADCILAVGTGLSPENTKMLSRDFINPAKQTLIHIDIEPRNVGWTIPASLGIVSDAGTGLRKIIIELNKLGRPRDLNERIAAVKKHKEECGYFSCAEYSSSEIPIAPERVVRDLNDSMDVNDVICLDAGNNRQWFARHFMSKKAGQVFAPGGVGGVGWGAPAALAAQMVRKDSRAVAVCGDGGMMMNLHCLETAAQYRLPVLFVVLNNSALGNIRDFQASDRRYCTEYQTPDFASHAKASGCHGYTVSDPGELKKTITEALSGSGPALIDVRVKPEPHFKLMG